MIKPLYEVACSVPRLVSKPSFQSLGLDVTLYDKDENPIELDKNIDL